MTTKLTIYKSLLRDDILVDGFTKETNLSEAIYSRRELRGLYVSVWVNDILIPPDDWHLFELTPFDSIQLVGQPQKGALPILGAIHGAAYGAITGFFAGGPMGAITGGIKGAMIGYSLGSLADGLLFPPTVPQVSSESQNPNYGWDGATLVTKPDGPISVVYGQHRISGALIMQYVTTDGSKNYLHMLINLGEGPISGIMKADGTGVCTATTDDPDIEINGQAYSSYENCTWDYRLGAWNQSIIEGFHGTKTYYADGRKISYGTPVTYTTTGTDITTFKVHLSCASLFNTTDKGDIIANTVDFRIEYKLNGDPSWTELGTYIPGISGKSKTVLYHNREKTVQSCLND